MKEEQNLELYQDIIDKILNNIGLTDVETKIVESDPDFLSYQKEFGLISQAVKKSALHEKLDFIKQLENNHLDASANETTSAKKVKPIKKRIWLIAAAFLFLLGAAYLVIQLNKGGNYDKDLIYEEYMADYPDIDGTRSDRNKVLSKAYKLYNDQQYRPAIFEFENLISNDENPKHKFYLAICLLRVKKFNEAQVLLEHDSLKNFNKVPVNFYLALSKIGTGDREEAIDLLKNPSHDSSILDPKRKKLLRILQR